MRIYSYMEVDIGIAADDRIDNGFCDVCILSMQPLGPGMVVRFDVGDNHAFIFDCSSNKAGLGTNLLDVVMPVVAWLFPTAEGLLNGVPVRQCKKDESYSLLKLRRFVDDDSNSFDRKKVCKRSSNGR